MRKFVTGIMVVGLMFFGGNMALRLGGEGPQWSPLERAFAASQATLLEVSMNGWASIPVSKQSVGQLQELLRHASQAAFGLVPTDIKYWEDMGARQAHATFITDIYSIETNSQSLMNNGRQETYLVLTMTTTVPSHSIAKMEATLRTFFLAAGVRPTVTTCFVGVLKGKLTPSEVALIVGQVLTALHAETQEFYTDGTSVNVVGFSRYLPPGVNIAGRHTNLSLMMHFDPENNKTRIWLASPNLSLSI